MRLGDLDALKEILEELAKDKFDSLYGDGIRRAIKEIDNAPTVEPHYVSDLPDDVVKTLQTLAIDYSDGIVTFERKRPTGKWIRKVDEVGFISHICSECGAEIEVEDCSDDKFCFNCGAKMQKGNKE